MKKQRSYTRDRVSLVLALVGLMCAVTMTVVPTRRALSQVTAPSWSYTGNLNKARDLHTATLLSNGKVLVVGGDESISTGNSAELYDPATAAWSITGNLNTLHDRGHTATLLLNGKVLVVGNSQVSSSVEVYDPSAGMWSYTGNLNTGRSSHTATLLPNGKILVAAGWGNCVIYNGCSSLNSSELYDPATGIWSYTGNLNTARTGHTATLLPNGEVLVLGGFNCDPVIRNCFDLNSAELYDPATGTWSNTGNLNTPRDSYTASLLPNGKVLIAGGFFGDNVLNKAALNKAELYDPATGTWSITGNLNTVRADHTATLLPNGKVLVSGGNSNGEALNSAELYDPATGAWSNTANLNTGRSWHTATLLPNGNVLLAGGLDGVAGHDNDVNYLSSAELYDPGTTSGPNTVQFSSASYTVSEGSPRVDITLSRTGDTTSSAAVNFSTNDAAGLTNCNVFNGIASPRCDYENTIGTATWAAGDATSKSFSIAIVDDSYAEGTESFTVGLNSPSGATLGTRSTATVTINDNDNSNGPNPIDSTNFFVRQQYIDFLGREPDPFGFAGWTSSINNCAAGDTSCDRIHVSQLFFQSEEFQSRGYFVYRFYPVAFGRKPDYAEFIPDLSRVSGFLDANQLEAAKVQFIADFMTRPAFASAYNSPNTPTGNQQYVDALLNTAGVTLSSRQSMIDALNNATTTRAIVLRQIVESVEVSNKYNHQAYAVMEYFGYLRRQPDAFYLDWIVVLDQSNNPRGMVTGFVTSPEYRQRFGP